MNQMEMKLKNQIVRNGVRMKKLRKNGMKNGVKFIENSKNKKLTIMIKNKIRKKMLNILKVGFVL